MSCAIAAASSPVQLAAGVDGLIDRSLYAPTAALSSGVIKLCAIA